MPSQLAISSDADARLAMLERHLQKNRSLVRRANGPQATSPSRTPTSVQSRPIRTTVFDDLYPVLERTRSQPEQKRQFASSKLTAAQRWCRVGELDRALKELKHLASELADPRSSAATTHRA